jgi:uncharacterized protein YydD (DUF2326 family)
MYLDYLRVYFDNTEIRKIKFKKGINLIVDNTKITDNIQETGNSVGKTTVLKLIDVCFGANPKKIYTTDRGNEYPIVRDFLINNNVIIELHLVDDLDNPKKSVVIERNFLKRNKCIRRINGKSYTNDDDFAFFLKKELYPDLNDTKPTIRQLLSTSIRYKDSSLANTIYNLDSNTSDVEYEAIYLYMFGINNGFGEQKQQLNLLLKQEETFKNKLEKVETKNGYISSLRLLENEISILEEKKKGISVEGNYEKLSNDLMQLKSEISSLNGKLNSLKIRKTLCEESVAKIEEERFDDDTSALELLYKEIKDLNINIHHTFDEMVVFHNDMVNNKATFMKSRIPTIDSQISETQSKISQLIDEANSIDSRLSKSISFEEYEKIATELYDMYQKKGELEHTITQITDSEKEIARINLDLDNLSSFMYTDDYKNQLQDNIDSFNKFFSSISDFLYKEKYVLKYDVSIAKRTQKPVYVFSAFNMNMSTGKIQGEMLAFDLAYIKFSEEKEIPHMNFILNDKKELLDDNQISNLVEYCNKNKECQIVFSMLRDKLPDKLNDKKYFAVELSQSSKFFRIEELSK